MTLLILHQGLRKRSLKAALAASGALMVICIVLSGPILKRIYESKPGAMISRAEYVRTAWALISDYPIMGSGLNTYVFVAPRYSKYGIKGAMEFYKNWYPPVHNIYLLWWSEIGIIGLSLHLIVWSVVIWVAIRNLSVPHETLFAINAGCLAGMVAFIIDGFFSFTLRINSIQRTFWVFSAIIFAIHYWRLRYRHERATIEPLGLQS
jgi:O-antigen ligase